LTILVTSSDSSKIVLVFAQNEKNATQGEESIDNINNIMLQYNVPAIVAALAAILAAIIAARNQIRLKKIEEINAELDARREYEYEARKRLYREFEPLIFILNQDSAGAYRHIKELAGMASLGSLHVKLSTANDEDKDSINDDYLKSTIYKLILPMAVFSLIQRRLTSFDLHLENCFRLQYALAKCLYFSCADNYYIALGGYDPSDYKLCLICDSGGLLKHSKEKDEERKHLKHSKEKDEPSNHPNHIIVNILDINTGMVDSLANSIIEFDGNDKTYGIIPYDKFEHKCFLNDGIINPSIKIMYETFSKMDVTADEKDYLKYLLIWRIFLLHVCVYWIMKELLQKEYSSRKARHNNNDGVEITTDDIGELIDKFIHEESDKFKYIPDTVADNSVKSKDKMDEDYSNSKMAIKNYLLEWLSNNYEISK
jgi:hypothetical protein